MWIKEKEVAVLSPYKVMRCRWASTSLVSAYFISGIRTDAWTYPAMPTDWGYVSAARSPSQYAGVTLSIPSLVPIRMSVG